MLSVQAALAREVKLRQDLIAADRLCHKLKRERVGLAFLDDPKSGEVEHRAHR